MKFTNQSVRTLALMATLTTIAASAHAGLDEASKSHLDIMQKTPDKAGALIYRGAVFAQHGGAAQPLFNYERRVTSAGSIMTAAHITQDTTGAVIIIETAQLTPDYRLKRFDAVNRQTGSSGSVLVSEDGTHLEYSVTVDEKTTKATEEVSAPLVTGPSLHGFILKNWETLASAKKLPVRMIVLSKMETYGFDIRREREEGGNTTFSITPSSFLVRLAVAPLSVTFDTASKQVVRYEGRVPPMEVVDGKLRELDARVNYTSVAPSYR
jgi:hypothetical protein